MRDYPDYKSGAILVMNENLADELVSTMGRAYGVEFMVKKPGGKLNGWVSYTYSRSLLREMEDRGLQTINDGEWYNAPHDKPHDLNCGATTNLPTDIAYRSICDYIHWFRSVTLLWLNTFMRGLPSLL